MSALSLHLPPNAFARVVLLAALGVVLVFPASAWPQDSDFIPADHSEKELRQQLKKNAAAIERLQAEIKKLKEKERRHPAKMAVKKLEYEQKIEELKDQIAALEEESTAIDDELRDRAENKTEAKATEQHKAMEGTLTVEPTAEEKQRMAAEARDRDVQNKVNILEAQINAEQEQARLESEAARRSRARLNYVIGGALILAAGGVIAYVLRAGGPGKPPRGRQTF